jgi:EAL domain-containing protein (putative c-di-GMP-specific phosphodiesterase class I)/CHASE2 domain-containing sensor protein
MTAVRDLALRLRWWAVPLLALLAGLAVNSSGWGEGVDRSLRSARDELRLHPAGGQIAIVEIDARSLASLDQWPWPRRHHAQLVDRLAGAGASLIAFDVNFATRSNAEDDQALEEALERAGGLVALPTFQQREGAGSSDVVEALPYEPFRNHAFLAGVNIVPDPDGMIRRLPLGTETDATPRPSMASLLAEAPGDIDAMLEIDYSIDPSSVPRFSFIDILEGRFHPSAIEGKRLIVGGTAADMEDRYTVPIHGVLPGVVVQALAAETIMAGGVAGEQSVLWPLLLALLFTIMACRPRRPVLGAGVVVLGVAAVLALPLVAEQYFGMTFRVVPALVLLAAAALGMAILHVGDRMRERAMVDAETGLPNLRALQAALHGSRTGPLVVAVGRIDRFAAIAAGLGPAPTVALVQRIADRIRSGETRTIYRIDEHSLAWVEPSGCPETVDQRLSALHAAMRTPVECGRLIDVTLGIGAAEACSDDKGRSDGKQQIANAALAADRAVRQKLPFTWYSGSDENETGWHLSLLGELDAAMESGEVWNAYQPKLDIRTGRICGVETLVRWTHRERGFVGPDEFIPVVEANGRAADLTKHVLQRAMVDAAGWRKQGHDLSVAVNVSATLLEDQEFIGWVRDALAQSELPPATLTIEVTESAAVKNVDQAVAALTEWRALGLAVSIDDYGTGQSSLGYLQRLPATELKIDKSFVQDVTEDSRNAIMVRSTIALAHQLGMKVVAEGVETAECLALLREFECDVAQGWLISKALPRDALEAFLAAQTQALAA